MTIEQNIPPMQYQESGMGESLILLPGSLTGSLSWTTHAEILAESYRVISLQLHSVALGLTETPLPTSYSVDFEVSALQKTLDDLGIQQADFAGWSYGAEILLSYALHHPSRVRSLTLIEPPAFWVLRSRGNLSDETLREQEFMRAFARDNVTEQQLIGFIHFSGMLPESLDPRNIPQWDTWAKHRQSLRIADVPFQHQDSIELVRQFVKPVLLIKGEGSNSFSHDIIDILEDEFSNVRVASFVGGHAPHIVSMQLFMERFTRFLATLT